MKINKYPDGTSYVSIPKEWEETSQKIVFKINDYESVIHLAQLCDVLVHNRVQANIIIPCLLDAQADKRFDEFHSSGLTVLARILDTYIGHNIFFKIYHPHNPEVVEALLTSSEIIDNTEFIDKVLNKLSPVNNLVLMSSDAGGFKPLMKLADKVNWRGETFSASKSRKYENNKSILSQFIDKQDFEGKDILIVDDICVYGGTFKGLSKLLKERNCGKLYLAVSHITIEHHPQDNVFEYFDKVFTTNSKFNEYTAENSQREMLTPANLEIIKLF